MISVSFNRCRLAALSSSIRALLDPWYSQPRRLFSGAAVSAADPRSLCTSTDSAASFPSHVGVVGSGQMGTGIAYVVASVAEIPVTVVDGREEQLQSSESFIKQLLNKDLNKGKLNQQQVNDIKQRIHFSQDLQQVNNNNRHSMASSPLLLLLVRPSYYWLDWPTTTTTD